MTLSNVVWHLKFVRKKPMVMARITKDYFFVRVLKKNRLRTVDFGVTYRCNSKCNMCSAKYLMSNKKNRNKKELSPEEIISVMTQAVKLGAIHMNLTGGEPTVRESNEINAIIKGVNKKNILSSMVTNSINITKKDLISYSKSGLDTIQLSLESMDPDIHDSIRGTPGNYKKLMKVFGWAKEMNLNICLSTVICSDNFDEVKRIIEFGKENDVFVLLNPISSSGEVSGDFSKSIRELLDEYYKFLEQGHVRADTIFNFRGGRGCPAGVERIYITPYGEVMTCPHVQVSYGNVREEPLKKIYKRISEFPYLKDFEEHCRHVFNKDYITKIMEPTFKTRELPVKITDHPIAKEKVVKDYLDKAK